MPLLSEPSRRFASPDAVRAPTWTRSGSRSRFGATPWRTSRRTAPWPTWTVAGSRSRVANEGSCRGRRPLVWGDPLCRLL